MKICSASFRSNAVKLIQRTSNRTYYHRKYSNKMSYSTQQPNQNTQRLMPRKLQVAEIAGVMNDVKLNGRPASEHLVRAARHRE